MHSGLYLIDKPAGFTSQQVLQKMKKIYRVKKIGHSGTLDKFATGLLLVAVGVHTRLLEYLLKMDKVYDFTVDFSIANDTLDPEGESIDIFDKPWDSICSKNILQKQLQKFIGHIWQTPPIYCALKYQGKRLSDIQRVRHSPNQAANIAQSKTRQIHIYNLRYLARENARVRFLAHVSSGTYIRSLGRDIGQTIDAGGVTVQLRRRKIGPWPVKQAARLMDLEKEPSRIERAKIADMDIAEMGAYTIVPPEMVKKIENGNTMLLRQNDWSWSQRSRSGPKKDRPGIENRVFFLSMDYKMVAAAELKNPKKVILGNKDCNIGQKQKKDCQNNSVLGEFTNLKVFLDPKLPESL